MSSTTNEVQSKEGEERNSKKVSSPDPTPNLVATWYAQCGKSCPTRWSEFKEVKDEHKALVARTSSVPIVHQLSDKRGEWKTVQVVIQDVSMRKILDEVLKDYQGLDLQLQGYKFTPPFKPLCHRWETLKEFQQQAEDPVLKRAASDLLEFLNPIMSFTIDSIADIQETGKIAFDDIWQIFAPGTLVTTKFYGVQTTCRVTRYELEETGHNEEGWIISMEFTDWNGERAGFSNTSMAINSYSGYRRPSSLPVFPISFLEDEASYKTSMIERGRLFEQLRGYHFMEANGVKISIEEKVPVQRPIDGRVCIDAHAYYTSCNIMKPDLKPLSQSEDIETKCAPDEDDGDEDGSDKDGSDSGVRQDLKFTAIRVEERGPAKRVQNLLPLTDEQCLIATPWVKGFHLKSKQWCELRIDQLQPMTWNDEAFDKLILPGNEKHLVWEFVEAKSLAQSEKFDDLIADKGRGLIALMFGPPGVGKTLTAEAVAEKSRVPLYAMSAAELGTKPDAVERALERALGLCCMWNAILLLDEADVFLGARTAESLARNELVAIFLRMLEYYQGIMFLTTNRIASIDPAFQSRIDLFLSYRDLLSDARRDVWCNFIERAGKEKFEVTDESLNKLSQLPLNGREIKNLIKSVQLLAVRHGSKVSMERLYMLAERRIEALAQANK